ncbi:hypothetical protein [Aquibacillus albus]|uniref:Uncharacterized protein n=1 Tax=Aquibacillus albus TaxID=1168171 RepID=A0ABS2N0L0_9BACI|nr:hypothetical protein [Aquibacillus albus]MBM7571621.1 hypothetical protein [Aquibacillus albus]
MRCNSCHFCHKQIERRDQLIVGKRFFRIRPFHYICYNKMEQETKTPWGFWAPVNGLAGNIRAVAMIGLAIWFLASDTLEDVGDIIAILALYQVFLRLLSYFLYERNIPV